MNRKEFIAACSRCSLGILIAPALLEACASTKYIHAPIVDSDLVVSLSDFEIIKNETLQYHKYIVVQHDSLQFPICVYRISSETYHALWMQCTHQGTELHVFGDRLQCPAHGSEFKTNGAVQNGPADKALRTFSTSIADNKLKIRLQ